MSESAEYVMRRAELLDQLGAAYKRVETITEQLQDLRRQEQLVTAGGGN